MTARGMLWSVLLFLSAQAQGASTNMGFGFYEPPRDGPCVSSEQRAYIKAELRRNVDALRAQGRLKLTSATHPLFAWPLQAVTGLTDYGFCSISYYVDHNAAYPGHLIDYDCGGRTYDQSSGYNHAGTDIFIWPFPWRKVNSNEVEIVAAAPGTIIFKQDGNYDHNCSFNNNPWNAVYVEHADGSVAWYGHMKSNSLTAKLVGDTVAQGEVLGRVGSSGSSTGPHLHFEVYDASNNLIDPFAGPCNAFNTDSWWIVQRPYYDSAIDKVATQSGVFYAPTCPGEETPNLKDVFQPGETVYYYAYYHDQLAGQTSRFAIVRPDGSMYDTWTHSISSPAHYDWSYWYWWYSFATNIPRGTWTFRVVYQSNTYEHAYFVGSADAAPGQSAGATRAMLGSNVTFTIVVTNLASDPGAGVTLTNAWPARDAAFVSASSGYTLDGDLVSWDLGDLAGHGATQVAFTVLFTNTAPVTGFSNVARVAMTTFDTNTANDVSTCVVETDHDGDGLPTAYETNGADTDGDTVPDYLDPDETFDMLAIVAGTSNEWAAVSGAVYQLQARDALPATGDWFSIGGPVTALQPTASASDTNVAQTQRFYRVILRQLP